MNILSSIRRNQLVSKGLLNFSLRTYIPTGGSSDGFIDLRSDTITRPSPRMREAMKTVVVGDDVFRDDPTLNRLQEEVAKMFGKQSALFVPSGTMGNLIGMMLHCKVKGEGAIVGHLSHVYNIERGGMSALGGIHPLVVQNQADGILNLKDIQSAIPPNFEFLSQPRVICLENTHNLCNGRVIKEDYVEKVKKIAKKHKLKMHLDGARCLNAATFFNTDPAELVKHFDTVNVCLSKGLGCPAGSLIIGNEKDIEHARVLRKMLGGGMRQGGVLGVCGLIALEDWQEVLQRDHDNAKYLVNELNTIKNINVDTSLQETNIFRFSLKPDYKKLDHAGLSKVLKEKHNILTMPSFANDAIRVVTHRDVSRKDLEYVVKCLRETL